MVRCEHLLEDVEREQKADGHEQLDDAALLEDNPWAVQGAKMMSKEQAMSNEQVDLQCRPGRACAMPL